MNSSRVSPRGTKAYKSHPYFVLEIFSNLIHLVNGTCSALSAPTWNTPA